MDGDDELPDLVRDTKLESTVSGEHTVHTKYISNPVTGQRRTRVEERWERREELGRGSFAVVWKEECISGPDVGKVRAVKEVRKEAKNGPSVPYGRELEAMAKFSQERFRDNFARSYGWFDNSTSIFIAMEYFPLGDLERFLSIPLEEVETSAIIEQVLEGVVFMHSNKFAHRDLKPRNVLVLHSGPHWWVKISDFGIAKRAQDTALRTQIGTPEYIAPEVRGIYSRDSQSGDEEAYSLAVDIWAVGAMTYRIILGRLPFADGRRLFNYVVYDDPFPVDYSISPDCTKFVAQCMAASPRGRLAASKALEHPWIQARAPLQQKLPSQPSTMNAKVSTPQDVLAAPSAGYARVDPTSKESRGRHAESPSESFGILGGSRTTSLAVPRSSIRNEVVVQTTPDVSSPASPDASTLQDTESQIPEATLSTPAQNRLVFAMSDLVGIQNETPVQQTFLNSTNSVRMLPLPIMSYAPTKTDSIKDEAINAFWPLLSPTETISTSPPESPTTEWSTGFLKGEKNVRHIQTLTSPLFGINSLTTANKHTRAGLAFSPDGQFLVSAIESHHLVVWNLNENGLFDWYQNLECGYTPTSAALSKDELTLVSNGPKGTTVWKPGISGRFEKATITDLPLSNRSLEYGNGHQITTHTPAGWRLVTFSRLLRQSRHSDVSGGRYVSSIASFGISSSGTTINVTFALDLDDLGELLRSNTATAGRWVAIASTVTSKLILVDILQTYGLDNIKKHKVFNLPTKDEIKATAISPNGRRLAVSTGRAIQIFDRDGNAFNPVGTILRPKPSYGLQFSSSGEFLIFRVGAKAPTLEVWRQGKPRTFTGQPLPPILTGECIRTAALSPDDRYLAVPISDGSILIWQIPAHW